MAETQDELLVAACARVREHPYPAYVKSSELRYLAVNEAYARLFGHGPAEMIGLTSDESGEAPGHGDRDDPERRCLIFGNPERARYLHPFGGGSFDIAMKRERISPTLSVLVGLFTPSVEGTAATICAAANLNGVAARLADAAAGERGDAASGEPVEDALDALGAGVAVFGADNRLRYANRSMREFYRLLVGTLADGPVSLAALTRALHDIEVGHTSEDEREHWVAARLACYDLPLHECVVRLAGGWIRLVTQRRPDGTFVALRLDVTALKESEGRLKQHSQEISLYRALLDELPVASFMRDENQRMIFANRAYVALTGRQPEELLGLTTLDMFPGQGEKFHAQNQLVLDTGELLEAEIDHVRPDGSVLPTISRLCRVTTLDEKRYLIGSITDTTVLKKREGQLIEAQREAEGAKADLESIVESLPVGIVVVDVAGNIELVNGAFEELWDGALPPMKGRPLGDLLRFQQAQGGGGGEEGTLAEAYEACISGIRAGETPAREVAYASGRTVIEAGCAISGGRCLLTYIDITERREREREVLETRSALEEVGSLVKDAVSSMSQGLLIIEDGVVVLSNEALSAMIAMPRELLQSGALVKDVLQSCIDRDIAGFLGEEPVDASRFGEILFTGKPASLTVFSGYQRWLRLDVTPTSRGRDVIVFSDITDLKSREDELRRLVTRAETADKAKSEFLANMSHEIRTPMNGVLGMAELLAKSNLDTRQKTFIDIMVKSGNALLTIINDILDFSKIDAGQMTLRATAFNPVEAIEDVATLLSAKAAEKDIELVVRGAANMPAVVMGDAGRFRQIVTNLVGNAVKFTDRGHVLIDLSAQTGGDGGVEIIIRVEDTGAGIPAEKMESIFEKFSQVDASSTRRHEGTGLGLAITDGLTRLFGGTLTATSEVGSGSAFTVRLPMALAVAALPARIVPARAPGARILVIDGHDLSRKAAHDMLLDWGFDATAVGSETEALAVLAAAGDMGVSVDAVLLDYHPERAFDFVRALREGPRTAGIAVIMLTSMTLPADDRLLASPDIQAHLMKPVRADLLRETVSEVLRAMRGTKAPAQGAGEGKVLPLRPHAATSGVAAAEGEILDVLVAEDNEVNQILFTQMLMASGLRFRLVENGQEAVEVFRASRPGMILMDISMPVMDGLQASRAIRAIESGSGRRVPIVAVTAHVLDGDREDCLAAGMDDYLTKPISIEKLEEKLDRWLKRSGRDAVTGTLS
ncbi:PAS domain-containing hybrid sensor histidine kinase/response regulator [Shinella sp.]|uniref:PAS domain-containing hybrid sensor histidine kinase/response regulator n=1 Tax=Shinella sp. TaxID=1870904 RepID=UPI002590263E|nr:PAS domain-containing hybrid sensor histidine kinase/response regulator [Shinella sp.]MCW5711647.1 PAS-domain containing protein [Shinella sp.]